MSFSEIETVSKRASKAIGYSWGISEEIGKSIRILEMFNLPGISTLNQYFKKIKNNHPKKLKNILKINKSNWANLIDKPPFYAYGVTCGITFTFGGLKVDKNCQVLNKFRKPIKGLFAAGEIIGGIFYFNYPGGSGLTSGAVFGKIAGKSAAKF